ncbi:MAG: DegT/DnrJ/EryC1/StrS aminotransferase family protein [Nitrospirota bacterium]|jgi:CDP-6-deoxy-D-xylo-4-hexulose-3-dehydrase
MMLRVRIGEIRIGEEEKAAVLDVLDSGRISEGARVREFESLWANYIGKEYCVAVNSGTSALLAGLFALLYDRRFEKVRRGSKVITSPVTYAATSNAVALSGMEPVYVDIDPHTFTLDVNQIESLLREGNADDYSIILPVHLMGYPNDMDAINLLADKYDLVVFEDSAQAHGTTYKGKMAGSLSLLSDYSFYIAHNIQVGEMGAIVTGDRKIKDLVWQIKANGRACLCKACTRSEAKCPHGGSGFDPRFTHEHIGFNFKTTDLQAAVGLPQVRRADSIKKARQGNVKYLNEKLAKYRDVFDLPLFSEDISYIAYPLVIKDNRVDRGELMAKLERNGIEVRPLFGCIPTQQPSFRHLKSLYEGMLPNADFIGGSGFYVGCHQYLSEDALGDIAGAVESIFANR